MITLETSGCMVEHLNLFYKLKIFVTFLFLGGFVTLFEEDHELMR